jgi:uncharacterized protein (TIGR00369 family)
VTSRSRSYDYSVVDMSRPPLADRSGVEFFKGLQDGSIPEQPITQTVGWDIDVVENGYLSLLFEPKDYLLHAAGLVHGGVMATLLDSAMSGAVMTTLEKGQGCTTIQLNISPVRGIRADAPRLRIEGRVVHGGRQTGVATGTIKDEEGRLYAHGSASCLIFKT